MLSAKAQDSKESFKEKLSEIIKKQTKYAFTDDANDSLNTFIEIGLDFYKTGDLNNNQMIVDNFQKLINEMVVFRERRLAAWGNNPKVSKNSIKKAKKSICPLYPWCK